MTAPELEPFAERRPGMGLQLLRAGLAGAAAGLALALDLRFTAVLIGFAWLTVVRWDLGLPVWLALTGILGTPIIFVRSSAVVFSSAALSFLLVARALGIFLGEPPRCLPAAWVGCLIAFGVVAVVSGLAGALDYDPTVPGVHRFVLAQTYAVALVLLPLGAAWLSADQTATPSALRRLYIAVVGVTALRLLDDILRTPWVLKMPWWQTLAAHSAALTYANLLVSPPRQPWLRVLAVGFVLFATFEVVGEPLLFAEGGQWISGWIMISVPLAVISAVRLWRHRGMAWLFLPPALAASYLLSPSVVRAYRLAEREGDFGRILIWKDALALAWRRPILGVGPGNYIDYVERYASWHPYGSAHGNYQQVAAEMGFLGLAALLTTVVVTAWMLGRLYRRAEDAFVRAFALGAFATLLGQSAAAVVGDYLIPSYHNGGHTTFSTVILTWVISGAAIGLGKRSTKVI